ncbi:ATP-binding protein [Prevotella copri]|uniref:ATP-binding protein n=3 Tax=Segatella copri TaxID=165179 RepID=A0AAW5IMY1_9BACT|nr:ATP-binding protein [Segatella copri]MCP9571930.1 ATP-binding protein [Segatella copri]MCP9574848.1 ATP-binding protein [Segatella copri]MCP9577963.1 ATP-binding protein [Segatella copri]MCP9581149.1 ATP-binding protein [Segatella copri]MCP9586831.1 ATP-binding protein [Segatella copri]
MIVRPKRIYRKRIPYGMQNFEDVIKEDCYYVDKTPFIEQIEESNKYFFFIRPRRFGKTLTLSMLENYYDINKKDKFDEIFGKLYIGQNPTPEHNTYLIIHLNFAEVAAGLDDYKDGLDNHCSLVFNFFCDIYAHILPANTKEGLEKLTDAVSQLRFLCQKCQEVGKKIYLFIDEYDNFTNMILAHEEHLMRYRNQTHGEGYLRQFFNTIKGAAGNTLGRVFVTGVSPVTMDDLTSGFNIGTNYSLSPKFNEMTGFTEEEVREMLDYYRSVLPFNHTTDELIKVMKPWYDNYCFAAKSYGKTTMYNSVMVLNFISNYIDNEYDIPDSMVEANIRIDYDKLRMLIRHDKEFAHDASIIQQLVTQGFVIGTLNENFPAERINDPDNFLSLLFYFGMVTIDGTYDGETKFIIPNEVVRDQMYTYLLDTYKGNDLVYDRYSKGKLESKLAYHGEYKPYFEYIADCLKKYSSQRDKQKGEAFVHGFTLAMTSQNKFYRPISELDNDGGYADIFLSPLCDIYKDMVDSYIIELKYSKSQTTEEQVKKLFEEASAQISRYADSDMVREAVKTTKLHKLVVIYRGAEMVACEEI